MGRILFSKSAIGTRENKSCFHGCLTEAKSSTGFTLVELMVAVICMGILMGPIIYVYRSGSRSALEGMVKAEITLEAKRVIRQVQEDLKYSVFVLDYSKIPSNQTKYFFDTIVSGNMETVFQVLRFPMHGTVDSFIETQGNVAAYRRPIKIVYKLRKEDPTKDLFYSLIRETGGKANTLSKRVNFFEIRENPMSPEKTSWIITLQLAEVVKARSSDESLKRIEDHKDKGIKKTERRIVERTRGVQIADFYSVAASEFYSLFSRSSFIPNWHTLIIEP